MSSKMIIVLNSTIVAMCLIGMCFNVDVWLMVASIVVATANVLIEVKESNMEVSENE